MKPQLLLIEFEQDYEAATARYEEIKHATKGSEEHKEKLLLVNLISEYEKSQWDLLEIDNQELNKILKSDFGKST